MLHGLWKLTWLEIKIFLREPLGAFGTIGIPVLVYVFLGRMFARPSAMRAATANQLILMDVPVLATLLIAVSAVISLVTIVAIYREGGILRRLRATPLRPVTILTAHVLVKLLFTAVTLFLMMLAGRRYYPADVHFPLWSFTFALLIVTWAILSAGFVIASVVPTARFAQPIAAVVFYPMFALCGLFYPIRAFPPALRIVAHLTPLTYGVSLLQGVLRGDAWSAHISDILALAVVFFACSAISSRVFRWE